MTRRAATEGLRLLLALACAIVAGLGLALIADWLVAP